PLQVAERIATDTLDFQLGLDLLAEEIGQRPGTGELNVVVFVALDVFYELAHNRRARGIVDALGHCDHAAAEALVGGLHVREEFLQHEHAFRQIDQMRTIVGIFPGQRRGGSQEARMPAHDDREVDAGQCRVVEIGARKCLGDEARRRRVSWRVIVAHQVIVDGLRDVDTAQRVASLTGLLADDAQRIGGGIALGIQGEANSVRLQGPEDLLAVPGVWLGTRRTECRPRHGRDQLDLLRSLLPQVDNVFGGDTGNAVAGAVDRLDIAEATRFEYNAGYRLVDA